MSQKRKSANIKTNNRISDYGLVEGPESHRSKENDDSEVGIPVLPLLRKFWISRAESNKIWGSLKQQKLWGVTLFPTFNVLVITLAIIDLIFFILFILLLISSLSVSNHEVRYDDTCQGYHNCEVNFTLSEDFESPNIYYNVSISGLIDNYRFENFYGNHKKYIESRNYKQLRGDTTATSDCSPVTKNKDLGRTVTSLDEGDVVLNDDEPAIPCGLPAKYYFRDELRLTDGNEGIYIYDNDIALGVDRDSRFGNTGANNEKKQWIDMTDQRLMVWFQPEAFPNFIKLYGRTDVKLSKGTQYTLKISEFDDLSDFDVKKYFVISNTSFLGEDISLAIIFMLAFIYLTGLIIFIIVMEIRKAKNIQKKSREQEYRVPANEEFKQAGVNPQKIVKRS
ncbi:unnamed protein product [Moneuplotes crassus]|uniref:Uncharacterized protein n=1 Tax=Euplotes crassus TaxID=5936 RepID=A0AAD1US90_EUPCR|nr:unnamed protein product [Moneuplotes crassus]